MRNHTTLGVDNISDAVIADLGLSHNIPHWLEIKFDDAHAGVGPPTGHTQGHVRFRLATQIDRSVINLLGYRLREFRFLGVVSAASNHVHGKTRYLEDLLAFAIELRQFLDS